MPGRLAAVPDAPPRAIGLVRVSKEKDEGVSPELQRTAISDHCARRGFTITRWIEGIDESGSRRRSPWWARLDQAVELVEAGDADVLVVWRFSRTARQRLRWAVAIDRVEVAGGAVESATEPLDTSTASGRLARGMLAEMAAYEAEVIGNTWREVHARRTSRGIPANGKPRFGYRVVDGIHRPDPDTGPVLASLYRRYVAGESVYTLIEWLNREGHRTLPGYSRRGPGPWTQTTLRRTLDTGFGAGYITVRGSRERGIHEPIIDLPTWEAYQAARASRRTLRRTERSQYLLSGLMRCMHPLPDGSPCNSPMGGGQYGSQRQPKFRCLAVAQQRRHTGGYVTMQLAEREVFAWLQRAAADVDASGDDVRKRSPGRRRSARQAGVLAREIIELEKQLNNLTALLARGVVPEPAYIASRDEIQEDIARLREQHAHAVLAVTAAETPTVAAALLDDWQADALTVAEKRAVLRRLIERVEVRPGRPRAELRIVAR
jgi:DNA invertase Pin-like site-specific DNA recombinase